MSRSTMVLMPAGVLAIVLGLSLIHSDIAARAYSIDASRVRWSVAYAATLWLAAYAVGLPDVPRLRRQAVAASVGAAVLGAVGIALIQTLLGAPLLPRFVIFGAVAITIPWFVGTSWLSRWGRRLMDLRDRVVVVGEQESVAQLIAELDAAPTQPVLAVTTDPDSMRPSAANRAPLVEAARDADATVIVLDRVAQSDQTIVDQAALLHEGGIRVRTLSLFYEQWLFRLPISELERVSLMFDIGEVHRERYARRKRILDLLIAAAALPVLAVSALPVALGNLIANRGSLFFRQSRVGKGGQTFEILKYRTMTGAASGPGAWTDDEDPRITPWGRFLRRTHLDELPQIVNILGGDLSVVGPRPEQPHYVHELATKLAFYELRHLVQPGLTGWAQVNQGYASSSDDALEKLQYEFWYLRHQSMALDLRIMARTIRSVVRGAGR